MRSNTSTWQWTRLALLALAAVGYAGQDLMAAASTKPAAKKGFPYVGVVTGDNVYVRSRNDQNWYPTTKLNKGDRVEVHEEKLGWLKIRPPRNSFCYVDKGFVVRDRGNKGVIKGNNVYLRAGSQLPKFERNKRAVVTQLDKGAEVTIIGEHEDGYYKIVPPESAYYWIYGDYVKKLGAAEATAAKRDAKTERTKLPKLDLDTKDAAETDKKADTTKKPPADTLVPADVKSARERLLGADAAKKAPKADTTDKKKPEPAKPVVKPKPKPLVNVWQKKLDLLNAEWKAALRKRPRQEEDFVSLRQQFLPIAQQKEEDIPRQYAQIRLEQIDQVLDDLARLKRVNSILAELDEKKQARIAATTRPTAKPAPPRPDYQGVLERSFAFEGRYRIVNPADKKTLVYVEFPADTATDPQQYVDRFVQVWVKSKRYDESVRRNVVVPSRIIPAEPRQAPARPEPPAESGPPAPVSEGASGANRPATVDTLE